MKQHDSSFDHFMKEALQQKEVKLTHSLEGQIMKEINTSTKAPPLFSLKHFILGGLFLIGMVTLYFILPHTEAAPPTPFALSPVSDLPSISLPKLSIPDISYKDLRVISLLIVAFWAFFGIDKLFQNKYRRTV